MLNREHNHDLLSSWGFLHSGNFKFIFLHGTVLKGGDSASLFYYLISVNFSGLEERFVCRYKLLPKILMGMTMCNGG